MRPALLVFLALMLVPVPAQADRTDKLINDLSLGTPREKVAAIKALTKTEGPRADEPIIKALADGDTTVRLRAAEALGKRKSRRAVKGLTGRVGFDREALVRRQAIRSLGAIGDKAAVPSLIRALKDPDPFVVRLAALILGRFGDHKAAGPLAERYELNPHPFVAREIAIALAKLPEKRYEEFYLRRLTDGDAAVRRASVEALVAIGARDSYEYLVSISQRDNDPSVRKAAKDAAMRFAP